MPGVANPNNSATITVVVTDNGSVQSGGQNTTMQTFVVNVTPVNQAPMLSAITSPQPILESAAPAQQTINLSGITPGPGDQGQILFLSATSSNPSLIPSVSASYTSPSSTGSLSYTPVADASGTAVITVTVMDNGGNANNAINMVQQTFTVTVNPVNQPPTLGTITATPSFPENTTTPQTVNLTGISDGDGGTQVLSVFATSSNSALIAPVVTFTDSHQTNQTGVVNITPLPNQSGTAVITVTVMDNGSTANGGVNSVSQNFTVTVNPVNQAPTLGTIADPAPIAENTTALQTVNLTGISAGPGDAGQTLTITATSSNPALIPNAVILATATATLSGSTVGAINVTNGGSNYLAPPVVTLSGGSGSGAAATAIVTGGVVTGFTITNAGSGYTSAPTVTIAPPLDTATATATLSGSTVGAINVTDGGAGYLNPPVVTLSGGGGTGATATALLSNGVVIGINVAGGSGYTSAPTVTIASPSTGSLAVSYTSPNATGSLTYTPATNVFGTATITVTVTDNGPTGGANVNSFSQTFNVVVMPVNQAPTLAPIAAVTVAENTTTPLVVPLSGITAGIGQTENLSITAASNNTGVISNPTVVYTSPNTVGSVVFTPVPNTSTRPVSR